MDMGEDLVCSLGTMRLPTGLFSAMLLGVVAMLFGLAIGVTISGGLPDIIRTLADLGGAAGELAH